MPLMRCRRCYAYAKTVERQPELSVYKEVYFENGGLYDWRGRLIPDSASFSGVSFPGRPRLEPKQSRTASTTPKDRTEKLTGDLHYWCGRLTDHFGHYMLESLVRLWAVDRFEQQNPKFLFWVEQPVHSGSTSSDFFVEIFEKVGIRNEGIIVLDSPTVIQNIVVPESSFEINLYGTHAFANFCQTIGHRMAAHLPHRNAPVYLSKSKLSTGVARFTNEDEFENHLADRGVEIVHPELLPIAEQINIWRAPSIVSGYLGSQTHTAIFGLPGNALILNHEDQIFSNQIMIDGLVRRKSLYVHPENDLTALGRDSSFHLNFRLKDPKRTAMEFISFLDQEGRSGSVGFVDHPPPATVDNHHHFDEPIADNISIGRSALQSTTFLPHSRHQDPGLDAGNAVNGQFPPDYAFHTQYEDAPWWQVDLGQQYEVFEVRLFNRTHIGIEHARSFSIAVSGDAQQWSVVNIKDDGETWGYNDIPYRWKPILRCHARFVRITLLNPSYLHLKQVEVFGLAPL